jgi:hypothetical protein
MIFCTLRHISLHYTVTTLHYITLIDEERAVSGALHPNTNPHHHCRCIRRRGRRSAIDCRPIPSRSAHTHSRTRTSRVRKPVLCLTPAMDHPN